MIIPYISDRVLIVASKMYYGPSSSLNLGLVHWLSVLESAFNYMRDKLAIMRGVSSRSSEDSSTTAPVGLQLQQELLLRKATEQTKFNPI